MSKVYVNIYKQLTCKLTLPSLENICIYQDVSKYFRSVLRDYKCSCVEPCLLKLNWIGMVDLDNPADVTSEMMSYLGVDRVHHYDIRNAINMAGPFWFSRCCYIIGTFNKLSKIFIDPRVFTILLPYLPNNHVEHVQPWPNLYDDFIDEFCEMLLNIVCDELVIGGGDLTTNLLADILVNVNVAHVIVENCPKVNLEELRNHYPATTFAARTITWLGHDSYWLSCGRMLIKTVNS